MKFDFSFFKKKLQNDEKTDRPADDALFTLICAIAEFNPWDQPVTLTFVPVQVTNICKILGKVRYDFNLQYKTTNRPATFDQPTPIYERLSPGKYVFIRTNVICGLFESKEDAIAEYGNFIDDCKKNMEIPLLIEKNKK